MSLGEPVQQRTGARSSLASVSMLQYLAKALTEADLAPTDSELLLKLTDSELDQTIDDALPSVGVLLKQAVKRLRLNAQTTHTKTRCKKCGCLFDIEDDSEISKHSCITYSPTRPKPRQVDIESVEMEAPKSFTKIPAKYLPTSPPVAKQAAEAAVAAIIAAAGAAAAQTAPDEEQSDPVEAAPKGELASPVSPAASPIASERPRKSSASALFGTRARSFSHLSDLAQEQEVSVAKAVEKGR